MLDDLPHLKDPLGVELSPEENQALNEAFREGGRQALT